MIKGLLGKMDTRVTRSWIRLVRAARREGYLENPSWGQTDLKVVNQKLRAKNDKL